MNINEIVSGALDSARQTLGIDAEEKAPNALTLLKNDHEEVKALFKQVLEDDSDLLRAQRTTIAKIISALELHAKLEETLLYPAIHSKTKRDTEDRHGVLEAVEEHGSMKDLMKKIKRSDGRDDTIRAKVQVLSEIVEHHVKEEESSLFDEARRLLGERKLKEIGAEMWAIKQRANRRASGPARKTSARGAKKTPSRKAATRSTKR